MAASKTIGGINVSISATTDKFQKGVNAARKQLSTFQKSIAGVTAGVNGFVASLAGGVTVGALARFTKQGLDSVSALSEMSQKIGISTETLAGFQLAAEEAGVAQSTFERSILTMTRSTGAAANGVEEMAKFYKSLGLDAAKLNQLSPDRQFMEIADAIRGMSNENDQLNAAMKLFGTRGSAMVNLLRQGSGAMEEYQDIARRLGLTIGDDMAAKIEKATDELERMSKAWEGLKRYAAVAALPGIESLNETFEGISLDPKGFQDKALSAMSLMNPGYWFGEQLRKNGTGFGWTLPRSPRTKSDARGGLIGPMETAAQERRPFVDRELQQQIAKNTELISKANAWLQPVLSGPAKWKLDKFAGMAKQGLLDFASGDIIGKIARRALGMAFDPGAAGKKASTSPIMQSIAAQDPLSREGFGQRVRSLAQNDLQKIGKQQLKQQEETARNTRQIAQNVGKWNFQPAGI